MNNFTIPVFFSVFFSLYSYSNCKEVINRVATYPSQTYSEFDIFYAMRCLDVNYLNLIDSSGYDLEISKNIRTNDNYIYYKRKFLKSLWIKNGQMRWIDIYEIFKDDEEFSELNQKYWDLSDDELFVSWHLEIEEKMAAI